MTYLLFFLIVLLSNIIQGITGFAGTILAMPPSLMLVGYDVAKPVLNVLGLLAGVYVLLTHGKHVNVKELKRVVSVMLFGIAAGILLKSLFAGQEKILYKCLGLFIIALAVQGYYQLIHKKPEHINELPGIEKEQKRIGAKSYLLLLGAGAVHGMFVSGGPLLIGYLSKAIKEKVSFRATISAVWVMLNTVVLLDDIRTGLWTPELIKIQLIAVPFFIMGMVIGGKLYARMSQVVFMKLTYLLLLISGVLLLAK